MGIRQGESQAGLTRKIRKHALFQLFELAVAELAAKPKACVVFCRVQVEDPDKSGKPEFWATSATKILSWGISVL